MSPDRELRSLIGLAKRMPHTESARRDAASFASFEQRLEQRRGKGRRRALSAAFALSAGVAISVFALRLGSPEAPALSYRMRDVTLPSEAPLRSLAFSDGSELRLEQQAVAKVAEITSHGARVVLERGRAEVSIAKHKNAAWQLIAGPYTVRVTGTAFRLAWSREQSELEVSMRHGSVIVTGPMAERGVVLKAGQRLVGSLSARRLSVEDWPGSEPKPSAPAAVAALRANLEGQPPAELGTKGGSPRERMRATPRPDAAGHGWQTKVAQGAAEDVLSEARALGLARVLSASSASDLAALADAARYARQDALGQKALLSLRARFASSELARDSAFLLGRLSRERAALGWYERYLREQPDGTYVSQALGRSMMLCYELGDMPRAQQLSNTYLTRFPSGPYAASARKLRAQRVSSATP